MAAYERVLDAGAGSALQPADAATLFRIVRDRAPVRCLEVGLANAVSSLAILEALPPNGTLASIDPFQSTEWAGAGMAHIREEGYQDRHRLIEAPDYLALPQLVAEGAQFDLVFIDGWHSFDYIMLDMFYADFLTRVGGVVGFEDCNMPATRKALRFLLSQRPYRELAVAPVRYDASTPIKSAIRRILRWSVQDRWFEKTGDQQTPWDFYRRF